MPQNSFERLIMGLYGRISFYRFTLLPSFRLFDYALSVLTILRNGSLHSPFMRTEIGYLQLQQPFLTLGIDIFTLFYLN